jgi:Fe-S cluster assembly protein SufD
VDLPSAIARENVRTAIVVTIGSEVDADEPVVLHLKADPAGAYAHIVIDAQRHSRATVVLEHDTDHDVSGSIVTRIGQGAELTVLSAWNGSGAGRQLWQMPAIVERDAQFRGLVVSLAGSFLRLCPSVEYRGPGGSAEIWGAFLADGAEYQEHRIFVDHATPNCTSKVIYKGALSGPDSHTVWIGDVLVRREAVGIETYELNRNLLLNDGPRADSVPNLELETGDVVGAGHASATGRFDDEQLFYLQSRGVPESLARQLVVRGFFADVISAVSDATVRETIMAGIDKRIGIVDSEEDNV